MPEIGLELHDHVDRVDRVDVEVFVKTRFGTDLFLRNLKVAHENVLEDVVDFLFVLAGGHEDA